MRRQNPRSGRKRAFSFSSALLILVVLASACSRTFHQASARAVHYEMSEQATDEKIVGMIAPYKSQLDSEMSEVIGHCAETLTKQKPEGTLGNWICDLVEKRAAQKLGQPVDFAVQNYGGIRVGSLPKGPVRMEQIFELMPFENRIVVLHMKGADLRQFLDHMAASDGWPVSRGLRFEVSGEKAVNVRIGGEPLDQHRIYHFALPDYIANGGDRCFFLMDVPRDELPYLIRDAIADEVRALHTAGRQVSARLDGRITLSQ